MKRLGREISQETRLWDEASQKTIIMRSKEESHDYRYFPDPDLLPLIIDEKMITGLKTGVKDLPLQKMKHFQKKYLFNSEEARLLVLNPGYGDYFEEILKYYDKPRTAANWFFNELLSYITGDIYDIHIAADDFAAFLQKIDSGDISGKIGKSVIKKSFESGKSLGEIIKTDGLRQITDTKEIESIILKILEENPKQIKLFKSGKTKIFGYLVGEIMKRTNGHASPRLVNEILKAKIGEM
jgi:aspartyl-tRNA(Asn)/glutamyl-tRNA(Gln) amidotransferase subunit B